MHPGLMPLRCVFTDLDGTLLGPGGGLLTGSDGTFSLLGVRALEACHRAGAEVVFYSGRRLESLERDARLLGVRAFAFEAGAGVMVDGDLTWLTGERRPTDNRTIHEQIDDSGAPALLARDVRRPPRVPRAVERGPRGLPPVPRPRGRRCGQRAAGRARPRRPAAARQRRRRRRLVGGDRRAAPGARLPPAPGGSVQVRRRGHDRAHARLRPRGLHRRRRLPRGRRAWPPWSGRSGWWPTRCGPIPTSTSWPGTPATCAWPRAAYGEGVYEAVVTTLAERG